MARAKENRPVVLIGTIALLFGLYCLWARVRPPYMAGEGVVFTGSAAYALLRPCSRDTVLPVEGLCSPGVAEVRNMESILPKFLDAKELADSRRMGRKKSDALKFYRRQYVGFVKNGRKMIYVNALYGESAGANWKTIVSLACDGSDNFFGVVYDVQSHRLTNFPFNGP